MQDADDPRHAGWDVRGQQGAVDDVRYVRDGRACYLDATRDLLGPTKRIGVYRSPTGRGGAS
ncbi:hypothetical protein HX744_04460 [Pseudonocardia sp. ICBG1122]|nr:hypothetical protein [Pseudonocardia pini]